jgi:hypothetical protein
MRGFLNLPLRYLWPKWPKYLCKYVHFRLFSRGLTAILLLLEKGVEAGSNVFLHTW